MKITLRQPYSFCQKGMRDNQEDARFPDVDKPCGQNRVFLVCDGVGGLDAGEIASTTVAGELGEFLTKSVAEGEFSPEVFGEALKYAYDCLGKESRHSSRDMATTMTCVCFTSGGAFCAHIGDSRIYHIRPEVGIIYQSEDHSLVNALVHSGNLTPEEAINHPKSNVITRCMAPEKESSRLASATTVLIEDLEAGDYFFLCSDGVLHNIDDSFLFNLLSSDMSDKEKMEILAKRSFSSSDNNTAYLICVDSVYDKSSVNEDPPGNSRTTTTPIVDPENKAIDISPRTETLKKKISGFFKNLFS